MASMVTSSSNYKTSLETFINLEIAYTLSKWNHFVGRMDFEEISILLDVNLMRSGFKCNTIDIYSSINPISIFGHEFEPEPQSISYESSWKIDHTEEFVIFKIECQKL